MMKKIRANVFEKEFFGNSGLSNFVARNKMPERDIRKILKCGNLSIKKLLEEIQRVILSKVMFDFREVPLMFLQFWTHSVNETSKAMTF